MAPVTRMQKEKQDEEEATLGDAPRVIIKPTESLADQVKREKKEREKVINEIKKSMKDFEKDDDAAVELNDSFVEVANHTIVINGGPEKDYVESVLDEIESNPEYARVFEYYMLSKLYCLARMFNVLMKASVWDRDIAMMVAEVCMLFQSRFFCDVPRIGKIHVLAVAAAEQAVPLDGVSDEKFEAIKECEKWKPEILRRDILGWLDNNTYLSTNISEWVKRKEYKEEPRIFRPEEMKYSDHVDCMRIAWSLPRRYT